MYIKYNLERHLKKICEESPEYMDLYASWEISKKTYSKMLSTILYNYPTYSMHDGSHSEKIVSSIEMLLGEDRIALLGPTETWMILQCAYLHDLGMILPDSLIRKTLSDDDFKKELKSYAESDEDNIREAAEYIINIRETEGNVWILDSRKHLLAIITNYFRTKHAELSKSHLTESNPISDSIIIGGVVQKRLFDLVAEICHTHGKYKEDIMNLDYKTNGFKSDYIHPRFLAKLIRMGDLLDTDNDRFNDTLCQVYGTLPKVSEDHYKKHKSITHLLISPRCIEIRANCESQDVYRATRYWFDLLKEENVDFALNWSDIVPNNFTGNAPQIRTLEVLLNGKKISREEIDLKFEFKQKEAFELLEGSNVYSNKLDFLRELIQNALDAIKLQFWRDLKSGIFDAFIDFEGNTNRDYKKLAPFDIDSKIYESYKVEISTSIEDEENFVIEVKDNGIGISTSDLNYIKNPGNSWDKRDEYQDDLENMPIWLKPTGGFGVGLQSCFMMSNKIEIQTKTVSDVGKKIILESPKESKGYLYIEDDLKNEKRGTIVKVKVKQNEINKLKSNYLQRGFTDYDIFELEKPYSENDEIIKRYLYSIIQGSIFFNIEYSNYPDLITKNKVEWQKKDENGNFFCLSQKSDFFYFWDRENNILIKGSGNKSVNNQQITYNFKGIPTKTYLSEIISISLKCTVDFYGFSTKKFINLNRQIIIDAKEEEVNKKAKNSIKLVLEKFLIESINIKKIFSEDITILYLYIDCLYYNLINIEYNDKILNMTNENTSYLKKINVNSDQILDFNYASNKEFVKEYPIINVVSNSGAFNINPNDLNNLKIHENDFVKKEEVWEIPNLLFMMLLKIRGANEIKIIRGEIITYNQSDRNFYIETITFGNTNLIECNKRRVFSMLLEYSDFTRISIYGLKEYEKIATKKYPIEVKHVYIQNYNKNYIISPFTKHDFNKIENLKTKDQIQMLILEIKNKPSFEKLVKYVKENNISENVTMDEIRETYTKLMKDCLEIILE